MIDSENQIVVYQPNEVVRIEVRLENETVWLNRLQMAALFGRDVKTIGKHIANALREELAPAVVKYETNEGGAVVAKFATTAADGKTYQVEYYNLDVILSIGYRVKSAEGILFRRWANKILKEYLLKGYAVNTRMAALEDKVDRRLAKHEDRISVLEQHVDFFVKTNMPPPQGIFYEGQLWDACSFVEKLIAKAKSSILLIDSWVDGGTLDMLAKKRKGVLVRLVPSSRGNKLAVTDIAKFNTQYGGLTVKESVAFHDRFLVLDDKELYLIGASLKDLGKKCFGFTRMDAGEIAGLKARC